MWEVGRGGGFVRARVKERRKQLVRRCGGHARTMSVIGEIAIACTALMQKEVTLRLIGGWSRNGMLDLLARAEAILRITAIASSCAKGEPSRISLTMTIRLRRIVAVSR